jgi:hypothetical protein
MSCSSVRRCQSPFDKQKGYKQARNCQRVVTVVGIGGGGGEDLPSMRRVVRRYFFQMKAMLTMIITARYTSVAMTGGVQMSC